MEYWYLLVSMICTNFSVNPIAVILKALEVHPTLSSAFFSDMALFVQEVPSLSMASKITQSQEYEEHEELFLEE